MPPVTSTWSICGPSHCGQRVGHVPARPSPVCSAASAHPVIAERNTEWSSVALKSPAMITGPDCRSAHQRSRVARSLRHCGTSPGVGATEWKATKRTSPSPAPDTSTDGNGVDRSTCTATSPRSVRVAAVTPWTSRPRSFDGANR